MHLRAAVPAIAPGTAATSRDRTVKVVLAKAVVIFVAAHLALAALAVTLFASG
jgi:hypothetical protein